MANPFKEKEKKWENRLQNGMESQEGSTRVIPKWFRPPEGTLWEFLPQNKPKLCRVRVYVKWNVFSIWEMPFLNFGVNKNKYCHLSGSGSTFSKGRSTILEKDLDPLITNVDAIICIQIHIKMRWIHNVGRKVCFFLNKDLITPAPLLQGVKNVKIMKNYGKFRGPQGTLRDLQQTF